MFPWREGRAPAFLCQVPRILLLLLLLQLSSLKMGSARMVNAVAPVHNAAVKSKFIFFFFFWTAVEWKVIKSAIKQLSWHQPNFSHEITLFETITDRICLSLFSPYLGASYVQATLSDTGLHQWARQEHVHACPQATWDLTQYLNVSWQLAMPLNLNIFTIRVSLLTQFPVLKQLWTLERFPLDDAKPLPVALICTFERGSSVFSSTLDIAHSCFIRWKIPLFLSVPPPTLPICV